MWRTNKKAVFCFLILFKLTGFTIATSISYEKGYEYVYRMNSTIELKDVQQFVATAEIGFVNIAINDSYQELLLVVHRTRFSPHDRPDINGQIYNMSRWFSFEISRRGEISNVYYLPDEEIEVINLKKGFAGMLSAKLHHHDEIDKDKGLNEWRFDTNEVGKEGPHTASYNARTTAKGYEFRKKRTSSPTRVVNGISDYEKTLQIHKELNTVHSVTLKETFTIDFSEKPGFDPFYASRPVHAVSDFSDMDLPPIQATSSDELRFFEKRPFISHLERPLQLVNGSIQHDVKINLDTKFKRQEDIQMGISFIDRNMTCMRKAPPEGSMKLTTCFQNIVLNMKMLPDEELENVTNMYLFNQGKTRSSSDRLNYIDVLGAVETPKAQSLLLQKVIRNPLVNSQLYQRALLAIVSMDVEPLYELVDTLQILCLTGEYQGVIILSEDSRHRTCLTYGSLIRHLKKYGKEDKALKHIKCLHSKLGIHDPWLFKQKRSTMSAHEALEHDLNKVVLLDSVGNAGMDSSYEYIVSHINSSNSQWVKRTGIHALRGYYEEKVLHELEKVALYDEEETVRYEAMLQYQAHPLAVRQSRNELAVQKKAIQERSIWEKYLKFKLEAPGVDWMKLVGSQKIGASFGVLMENLLDVKLSLLKGSVDIRVHDEVYSRVHFGYVGINLDFYSARLCFKGSAQYGINIIQEGDLQRFVKLVRDFSNIVRKIVRSVKDGVEAFKSILDDDFSLKDIVDEFVTSVEELPKKVLSLGTKVRQILNKIASIARENLPPFAKTVKRFTDAVTETYERVREDVMTFYNSIVEGVKIIIPQAAEQIYESVQGIIRALMKIFKDPKTALSDIGKGVIVIYASVKQVEILKNDILKHTFVTGGLGPYWSDLKEDVNTIQTLYEDALHSVQTEGKEWVSELLEDDPVEKLTGGKMTLETIKENIRSEIEAEIEELVQPLYLLKDIGGKYMQTFFSIIDVFKDIREAYTLLRNGYKVGKSLVNSIFGHKFDKDFPRTRRVSGEGCNGDGFYPSRLGGGNGEYKTDGIDILVAEGEEVVAPVGGTIILSDNNNEIIIADSDDLPQGSELVLTNVEITDPVGHLTQVTGGEVIGIVTKSPCGNNNHIHVSVRRGSGVVDPSNYLEDRKMNAPKWEQICDDYKVVFKFDTVASGFVVGLDGRKEDDTTEYIEEDESLATEDMNESERPGQDIQNIKDDDDGIYKHLSMRKRKKRFVDTKALNTTLDILVTSIKEFLQNFSIRRIKLGAIIQLLEELGLEDTKAKMAKLIIDIKEAVSNEECKSPYHMTKQELENELFSRGKQQKATNEEMIRELTRAEISCPLITLALPENELLYCTLDEKCVGIECCLTVEVFSLLQKSIRIFVRLDAEPLTLTFGVNTWTDSIDTSDMEGDDEGFKDTGIEFDFLDGQRIVVKYAYKGTTTEMTLSFGIGICDVGNIEDCFVYIPMLENAVFPFPSVDPDGNLQVKPVDVDKYFEEIKGNIADAPIDVAKAIVDSTINDFLKSLGIDKVSHHSFTSLNTCINLTCHRTV
ncbi:uncharacterized protein LOC123523186 [Mercenaria mercenaria]|uniref:uncharacterized protein LOC123523186 n=1 Tax=Mercenaria mercenaria TaxID=6596 RepID=UPI00234F60DC|nr:uncharacterized protein LOC123523186 [Mercenaria mercenaria]